MLSLIYACMHACILNQMKQPSRYKSLNNQWSKKLAGHGLVQWIFHLCTWGQRSWWHAHSSDFLFHTCPLNNLHILHEYVADYFPPLRVNIYAKITIKPTFERKWKVRLGFRYLPKPQAKLEDSALVEGFLSVWGFNGE